MRTLLIIQVCVLVFMGIVSGQAKADNFFPIAVVKKFKNVVTVAKSGADFTDPVAAMQSINDASSSNPYLLLIGPGVYTLTSALEMKEYVHVLGSGQDVTTLTGALGGSPTSNSCLVEGEDNTTLRSLSLNNTGGGTYSVGLYCNSVNQGITVKDVEVVVSGGSSYNYAIFAYYTLLNLFRVSAEATGGIEDAYAIDYDNAEGVMDTVNATAKDNSRNNEAIHLDTSSPDMNNVTATASGEGDWSTGIYCTYDSSPTMTNVRAKGTGTVTYYAAGLKLVNDSSPAARRCTFEGDTDGIMNHGGGSAPIISQSTIIGGEAGGVTTCIYCDDGAGGTVTCN